MRRLSIIAIFILSLCLVALPALGAVHINEIAANEGSANFIELYSDDNNTVDLTNWQIEINGARSSPLFGTLDINDRFIAFNQATLGILLPPGADITLYNDALAVEDTMNASNFASGQSYGRLPDGSSNEQLMALTPDAPNQALGVAPIPINTSSMLRIKDVEINGDDLRISSGRDKIDDLQPGDRVSIEINVENTFTRTQDVEIENIEIEVLIEDIDDGDDLDFDSDDDFDLDAGDDEDVDLDFTIPYEVEDGEEYRIIIEAVGVDRNGTIHRDIVQGFLEIEKESHNVKITDLTVNPRIVSCQRTIDVELEITNLGEDRERNARLEIVNRELGVNTNYGFELDDDPFDDEFDLNKNFVISVPEDARAGEYDLTVNTYYNTISPSDSRTVEVQVRDCVQSPVDAGDNNQDTEDSDEDVKVSLLPTEREEAEGASIWGPLEISLLVAIILLVLAMIIFLIVRSRK